MAHMVKAFQHKLLHYAPSCIFGICANAGDETDGVHGTIYIHLQRINRYLRYKVIMIKTAYNIGAFQYRELGLLYFFILPTALIQFLLCYLKSVAQKRVILLQIIRGKITYFVFAALRHKNPFLYNNIIIFAQSRN